MIVSFDLLSTPEQRTLSPLNYSIKNSLLLFPLSRRRSERISQKCFSRFTNSFESPLVICSEEEDNIILDATFVEGMDNQLRTRKKKVMKQNSNKDEGAVGDQQKKKKKQSLEQIGHFEPIANEFYAIKNRCSPSQLYRAITKMSEKQKQGVKLMGFGNILKMKIDGIPQKLGSIVPTKDLDTRLLEWKEMYSTDYISPCEIVTRLLKDSGNDSFFFQVDFLVLFLATMVECYSHGKCKLNVLHYFHGETDIRMIVDRSVSALEFWDVDLLQEREAVEIKSGGFGNGKLLGMSVPIVRKSDHMDDPQLRIKKLEEILDVCCSHKTYLEKTIGLLVKENPANLELKGFVSKFESLFKEKPISFKGNNVRVSKHEAECSKMVSGSNSTDINATILDICMEVRKSVTQKQRVGTLNNEYLCETLFSMGHTPNEPESGHVEDVGHAFKKKKVAWNLNIGDMDAPCYSIGLTQDEPVAEDLSVNKLGGTFQTPKQGAPKDKNGLKQNENTPGEVQEHEDDSNQKKMEGTLDIVDLGGPSYSSVLKVDVQEFGEEKDEGDINEKEKSNKRPAFSMLNAFVKLGYHSNRNKEVQKKADLLDETKVIRKNPIRKKMPSKDCKSPFMKREVEMNNKVTKDEEAIWALIFRETEKFEIFDTKSGPRSQTFIIRSLKEDTELYGNVIDCWSAVLNEEEKRRSHGSPHRLYCSHMSFIQWMFTREDMTEADRLDVFSKQMLENLGREKETYICTIFEYVAKLEGSTYRRMQNLED
ncbi:hypothetical protein L1987_09654 [Smallanthus sonchifolius]|uniref:Uncharacterized protein n=1 Tax=Smallanthus sonchifolius TaxID=185202 RepID=A0ACB9JPZ5_9ASTR|nr:hypothetical protein L1987_09654 [Smallanthus sonchifolius]